MPTLKSFYVTFSKGHIHKIGDITLSGNDAVEIKASNFQEADNMAFHKFGFLRDATSLKLPEGKKVKLILESKKAVP